MLLRRDQRGQSLTEYVILITLVIVGSVVAWTIFRGQLNTRVESTAETIERTDQLARWRPELPSSSTAQEDLRPDTTMPLPEPSLVEQFFSNPETILAWLFLAFLVVMVLSRMIRKHYREQEEEEDARREEARRLMKREFGPFSGAEEPDSSAEPDGSDDEWSLDAELQ